MKFKLFFLNKTDDAILISMITLKSYLKTIITLLLLVTHTTWGFSKDIWFPAIFSDNMVLQQQSDVSIWGKSKPDADIIITTGWNVSATCKADKNGKWITKIKTPLAGGPYSMTIKSNNDKVEIKNILIGEVWICSGQSNMEMPLAGWPPNDTILGSTQEIWNSTNHQLRTFTVKRSFSPVLVDSCMGEWVECNPQTAGIFSATAYFFGKKLYETLKIPIGLIHTSWGGTPVEAWTDKESLLAFPEYTEYFNKVPNLQEEYDKLASWIKKHPVANFKNIGNDRWKNLDLQDANCSKLEFNDSNWLSMELPQLWERTSIGEVDGVVWFRKIINIPKSWANKELELSLGMIDDMDITLFNGEKVGGYEEAGYWQVSRKYKIPAHLVKAGQAVIAVRVIDMQGGGGIWGEAQHMYVKPISASDDERINLSGTWKLMPVAEFVNDLLYVYDVSHHEYLLRPKISVSLSPYQPAVLFNAMIYPLIPYRIKGAIWYQGESNVGRAVQYEKLFATMINGWRKLWQQGDFPFYYVQIAPWKYSDPNNEESGWLREAQRRVLHVPNTGMVVTLDIGNVENIHPAKKREVGERLAFWALAKDYQKNIIYSGPAVKSIQFKDGKAFVSFNYADNGLMIKNSLNNEFEIAGSDQTFLPAQVEIKNNQLIMWNRTVKDPVYVRYAFKNGSEAALFNQQGLPASTFTNAPMQK